MILEKIFFNWPITNKNCLWWPWKILYSLSGLRGEDLLEIDQTETRIAYGGHVCEQIGTKLAIFTENLPEMLPTKFRFIWLSGFSGKDF